jgi:hypothetical protein
MYRREHVLVGKRCFDLTFRISEGLTMLNTNEGLDICRFSQLTLTSRDEEPVRRFEVFTGGVEWNGIVSGWLAAVPSLITARQQPAPSVPARGKKS